MNNKWFTVRRKLLNNIVWILLLFAIILIGGMEPSFFTPRILGKCIIAGYGFGYPFLCAGVCDYAWPD